jgi:hypothetical protein
MLASQTYSASPAGGLLLCLILAEKYLSSHLKTSGKLRVALTHIRGTGCLPQVGMTCSDCEGVQPYSR